MTRSGFWDPNIFTLSEQPKDLSVIVVSVKMCKVSRFTYFFSLNIHYQSSDEFKKLPYGASEQHNKNVTEILVLPP